MRIEVDGQSIGFDDSGGAGTPLVLLHGFGADRTSWDAVASGLAGVRVVRVDLRGCGESPPGTGPALMEQLAGDVAGLLGALQIERAILAGHSLGGYVAFAFFRMYAERVAGLGLVATHARADTAETAALRDELAGRAEADGSWDAILASYVPRLFAPEVYAENPALVAATAAVMARQDLRGAVQLLRGMQARVDSEDLFADVHVPVSVVVGERDAIIPVANARRPADGIAGALLTLLPTAGHSVPLEAPHETAASLRALVARAG